MFSVWNKADERKSLLCCYFYSDFRPIQSFTEKAESSSVTKCANFGTDGVEDRAATEDSWPGQWWGVTIYSNIYSQILQWYGIAQELVWSLKNSSVLVLFILNANKYQPENQYMIFIHI